MKFSPLFANFSSVCLVSMSITGCTQNFSLPVDEPTQLTICQSGRLVDERPLAATDPVRLAVSRWLAANPDGWSYAFITRAPRIYLKGQHFYVNVSEAEVSVKYCRGVFNCQFWVKKDNGLFHEVEKTLKRYG